METKFQTEGQKYLEAVRYAKEHPDDKSAFQAALSPFIQSGRMDLSSVQIKDPGDIESIQFICEKSKLIKRYVSH